MTDKKSFILYLDRKKEIDLLSNEQCGILFKAIFEYVDTGNILEIDDLAVKVLFSFIASQIDENAKKWKETCQKRSEAGKKGMASRWSNNKVKQIITNDNNVINAIANDNKAKQTITKITDTDTVTVLSLSKDNDNIKQQASTAPKGAAQPAGFDEELYREIPLEEIDPNPDNWA